MGKIVFEPEHLVIGVDTHRKEHQAGAVNLAALNRALRQHPRASRLRSSD